MKDRYTNTFTQRKANNRRKAGRCCNHLCQPPVRVGMVVLPPSYEQPFLDLSAA